MNARLAAILAVLGALLVASAFLYYGDERSRQASNVGTLGQSVMPGLKAAEVAAIRLREPGATLTLERKDGGWTIAERAGFPASHDRVRDFVLLAIALRVGQSEPIGEADRARLKLDASGEGMGTVVEFLDAAGKPLAGLVAGAKYFRKTPDDPARAAADGRFVMRAQDPKTVFIVSDPLAQASAQSAGWIDTRGIAAERVKSLDVRPIDGEPWRIERADDNTDWKIDVAPPAGMHFMVTSGNAAAYSMGLLEIADVAAPGITPAQSGLDAPTVVVAQTFDGLGFTLKLGKREGKLHYASIDIEGTLLKTRTPGATEKPEDREKQDKDYAAYIAKVEARLPQQRELSKHVLLIESLRLEDILKKRAALFEKDEKKEAAKP